MGSLDPVTLEDLAMALRDATWHDVRIVPGGVVQRVRVEAIIVRRREEEVEFIQVWATDDGRHSQTFTVHAEEIWWMRPTEQEDVTLITPFNARVQLELSDGEEARWEACIRAVAAREGMTPDEVRAIATARLDERLLRYKLMLVMAKLTPELRPGDVTRRFNYHSPQPLTSARSAADRDGWDIDALAGIAMGVLKDAA